jgi:hypothetical protein
MRFALLALFCSLLLTVPSVFGQSDRTIAKVSFSQWNDPDFLRRMLTELQALPPASQDPVVLEKIQARIAALEACIADSTQCAVVKNPGGVKGKLLKNAVNQNSPVSTRSAPSVHGSLKGRMSASRQSVGGFNQNEFDLDEAEEESNEEEMDEQAEVDDAQEEANEEAEVDSAKADEIHPRQAFYRRKAPNHNRNGVNVHVRVQA